MHNVDVLASNKIYQGSFLVFTSIFKQRSLSLREIFDDIPDHVAQCCGGCARSVFNCTAVFSRSYFPMFARNLVWIHSFPLLLELLVPFSWKINLNVASFESSWPPASARIHLINILLGAQMGYLGSFDGKQMKLTIPDRCRIRWWLLWSSRIQYFSGSSIVASTENTLRPAEFNHFCLRRFMWG